MPESVSPTDSGFLPEELSSFLFAARKATERRAGAVAETLTPDNFLVLLELKLDAYCDGDPAVIEALQRFARHAPVDFVDPTTPEEEFTLLANKVEVEISSFIESNQPIANLDLLSLAEFAQISQIYNPNNLLAFAKELVRRSPVGLTAEHVDMMYRYRTILNCLVDAQREVVDLDDLVIQAKQNKSKVGARTWAGDVHPYGHLIGGIIDPVEYRDFSEHDETEKQTINIDGVPVNISKIRGAS